MSDSFKATVVLGLIKAVVCVYDIVSWPIYFLVQQPWKRVQASQEIKSRQVDENDPYSEWQKIRDLPMRPILQENTIDGLLRKAIELYGGKNALGYREVLGEEEELQPDGRSFTKLVQGDFKWYTYKDVDERVNDVARGLILSGVKPGDTLMIFADTRIEWFISAHAAFRLGANIATLYATLGLDGIAHGLEETEVTHLVTSTELLPKVKSILPKVSCLDSIIYFSSFRKPSLEGFGNIKLNSFDQIEELGRSSKVETKFRASKPDDIAIIMYTSGSTGVPKGVMITHKNVMATIRGLAGVAHSLTPDHVYMAYLPLAHVLEMATESYFVSMGISIGYSSAHTMTDKSTAVKRGCNGDATLLRPTIIVSVPLVLDRIKKAITDQIESRGPIFTQIFDFAMKYKTYWLKRGYRTPIFNFLLCRRFREILGGRIRYVVSGGAPLSPETHTFIRNFLDCTVISGYGLTETAAGACLMDFDDLSVGRVGSPLYGLAIKLVDWPEGNYFVTDKPNPRGEVVVGGDCISCGYYKNETLTQEFYKDENGKRWFYTGDIGEIMPDGSISLIDRKKDLVKLQFGEYISLGKIETELKLCPLVDNICVYGDSLHNYVIALVVPNVKHLQSLAEKLNKSSLSFEEKCRDPALIGFVKQELLVRAKQANLNKMEVPTKIFLAPDEWTPDSGLVTAALKIRRNYIYDRYKMEISRMYGSERNVA